jgi:hypothetical protein
MNPPPFANRSVDSLFADYRSLGGGSRRGDGFASFVKEILVIGAIRPQFAT